MLKQTENETESCPAAKVRVTPEELAAAITRLEKRKDADARQTEGTVAIGEIVQQLGLEATPEEVLAEVEKGRRKSPKKQSASPAKRLVLALGLTGILLGLVVDGAVLLRVSDHPHGNDVQPTLPTSGLVVGDASGRLVMLSEVGDEQPVHSVLYNGSGQFEFIAYQPGYPSENTWTLVKHHGQVYVHGWTLKASKSVLEMDGTGVTATPSSERQFLTQITLPLNAFNVAPTRSDAEEFHAVNIHLDKYAWEKWQP